MDVLYAPMDTLYTPVNTKKKKKMQACLPRACVYYALPVFCVVYEVRGSAGEARGRRALSDFDQESSSGMLFFFNVSRIFCLLYVLVAPQASTRNGTQCTVEAEE